MYRGIRLNAQLVDDVLAGGDGGSVPIVGVHFVHGRVLRQFVLDEIFVDFLESVAAEDAGEHCVVRLRKTEFEKKQDKIDLAHKG